MVLANRLTKPVTYRLVSALGHAERFVGDVARAGRFLSERRVFKPRDDDIFVVTYPRSGTTWLQYILHLMLSDAPEEAPCFNHLCEVSPWFERNLSLGYRTAADFDTFESPRIFKSHLPPTWLPVGGRVIHCTRHLPDVIASYFRLYRSHLGYTADIERFRADLFAGKLQYGRPDDFLTSWQTQTRHPTVLPLRYESLQTDFIGTLRSVASFLGVSLTDERAAQIQEKASFAAMKAAEEKFDPITEDLLLSGKTRGAFLRQGQSTASARGSNDDACRQTDADGRPSGRGDAPDWKQTAQIQLRHAFGLSRFLH